MDVELFIRGILGYLMVGFICSLPFVLDPTPSSGSKGKEFLGILLLWPLVFLYFVSLIIMGAVRKL